MTRVDSQAELRQALEQAHAVSLTGEVIAEEFVVARELSIEGISFNGQHQILAYTDKCTTGPPHFVETEHHQPSQESPALLQRIGEVVVRALDSLAIEHGASHTEVMVTTDDQVLVTEVGARMGGDFIGSHLVALSTGYDYLEAVLSISLGREPAGKVGPRGCSGVLFMSPLNPDLDRLHIASKDVVERKVTGERKAQLTRSADRHGYIIYHSDRRISAEVGAVEPRTIE